MDIARKAGVSQATIYNNFDSKDALAREFVTDAVEQLVNSVQAVLLTDKPYWEKMTEFIRFISEMMAQGKAPNMDITAFNDHHDLLNDPDLKKVRAAAGKDVGHVVCSGAGREKGGPNSRRSVEEALRLYFKAFMEIFPSRPTPAGLLP